MTDILKRTTYIVGDAEKAAKRYEHLFGWTRYYDNELPVDGRFPPVAPDQTHARLIMLKADDPQIGMLGFMSYIGFTPPDARGPMGLGSSVLVIQTDDILGIAERAKAIEGMTIHGPVEWEVPAASGGKLILHTLSATDPDGIYFEASARRPA